MRAVAIRLIFLLVAPWACSEHTYHDHVVVDPGPTPTAAPSGSTFGACLQSPLLITDRDASVVMASSYSLPGNPAEPAAKKVRMLVRPFYLDPREVDKGCYAKCVAGGACTAPTGDSADPDVRDPMDTARSNEPVGGVDQYQAAAFCRWRGGRLPTLAEMQFAFVASDDAFAPADLLAWATKCGRPTPSDDPACASVLAQARLQEPLYANHNTALADATDWSVKDRTPAGVVNLFGGVAERTVTHLGMSLETIADGEYDFVSEEVVPYDPAKATHQLFMPAGVAGLLSVNGGEYNLARGPGGAAVRDIDVGYSIGFRCAFPATE
jgi:formylglycine-generating enzyme required for sulfatase activity